MAHTYTQSVEGIFMREAKEILKDKQSPGLDPLNWS